MKCPRCGAESSVLETRARENFTTSRRRECLNGHRFSTLEMHQAAACSAKQRIAVFARTVADRIGLWHRDREIARNLHIGWRALAERYALTRTAIYLAAKRGRSSRIPAR